MSHDCQKRFEVEDGFYAIHSDPSKTDIEFQYILFLCAKNLPIGYGAWDSFLAGPDIERRVCLETEAKHNEILRTELIDTLNLNQSKEWTIDQHQHLSTIAGIGVIYDPSKKQKWRPEFPWKDWGLDITITSCQDRASIIGCDFIA